MTYIKKSVWQYMRYCLKVDKPLYLNNTMTLIRYESDENKFISWFILLMNMLSLSRQLSRPVWIYYQEQVIIVNLVNMRLIDWETS